MNASPRSAPFGTVAAIFAAGLTTALAVIATGTPDATADTDEWLALTPAPLERSEVGAARIGGSIYVVGGLAPSGASSKRALRYDIGSDSWELVAPMPVGLNHPGVTAHRGILYVHGGYRGPVGDRRHSAALYRYNPSADSWSRPADSAIPRAAHALAGIGGKLYAAGGANRVVSHHELRSVEVYDIDGDEWKPGPGMEVAREHVAGAVANHRLYVFAGRAEGENLTTVERFNPRTRRWRTLPPMGTARSGIAAAVVQGGIVVFGGEELEPGGQTIEQVERFDLGDQSWSYLPDMLTPRHGLGGASRGDRVYALLGGPIPRFTLSDEIEFLDLP